MNTPNAAHAETPMPTPRCDAAEQCNEEESVFIRYARLRGVAHCLEQELAALKATHATLWQQIGARERDDLRKELQAERRRGEALAEALKAMTDHFGCYAQVADGSMNIQWSALAALTAHAEGKHP